MKLDVSKALKNPGQSYSFDGSLVLPEMEILDEVVRFDEIAFAGNFTGNGESISLDAAITATVHAHCAMCLDRVSFQERCEAHDVFVRELNPDDPDLYPLEGHTIDLTDPVKDALLLELPIRFVCRKDCKGLCPVCGKNRNKELCTCQEGAKRLNPFSALSELLTEDEEV